MLKTPIVNGARQELPYLESPLVDGARRDIESVEKLIDGAWQEVWSSALVLDMIANTLSTGAGSGGDFESGFKWLTTKGDGGSVTYAVEGDFNNPTISFLYEIWCDVNGVYASGGDVYAYGVKADGTVEEISIVSSKAETLTQAFYTFTGGAYTKIGFRYRGSNWGTSTNAMWANICNFTIDGKKCVFNPDDNFNFN